MGGFKDELAWLLHDLWADEMAFVFGKYFANVNIFAMGMQELIDKINSSYDNLPDEDKEHYRNQAKRIIKVFNNYIERQI